MTQRLIDPFGARAQLKGTDYSFYRLDKLRRMADERPAPLKRVK